MAFIDPRPAARTTHIWVSPRMLGDLGDMQLVVERVGGPAGFMERITTR